MTGKVDIVYVVHGSNAHTWWRQLANGGYPWWRRWSLFCHALRQAFGEECEIRDYRWSGHNTHLARITAGTDLAIAIENQCVGRRVHIVGHSHGGNVALTAANHVPAGTIESIVLLANPNMALVQTDGPPQWLYWGKAAEDVERVWNLYSPDDRVQCAVARAFHGVTATKRSSLLVGRTYGGPGQRRVHNGVVRWRGALAAHRALHSSAMGTVVGKLLRGGTFAESMAAANLLLERNEVRDRGGWSGIARSQEMIRGRSDPSEFDLGDGNEKVAILLIHGFTASPSEMRPMADFIRERTGWRCKAIVLPGHGTRVEDLQGTRGGDWVDAADKAYTELTQQCRHVFLAGVSLGAVLCCHVALRRLGDSSLRGLILLAPAFGVSRQQTVALRFLCWATPLRSKGVRAAHYFLEKKLFSYVQMPLNRAVEVVELGRQAWRNLDKLKDVPVLMFAGELDTTVSLDWIRSAARKSPWIRLVWLPKSRHILTVEPDSKLAFEKSVEFMRECVRTKNGDY